MITLAGCGPGSPELITPAVRHAVAAARLLAGSQRLLDCFPEAFAEKVLYSGDTPALLESLARGPRPACVLVSGDPGLCSLARPVIERFGRKVCRSIPGVSSVQAACAAAQLDWLGVAVLSCHGRRPPLIDPGALRTAPVVAILGGSSALPWIVGLGAQLADGRRAIVCERLGLAGERVREMPVAKLGASSPDALSVILLVKDSHE